MKVIARGVGAGLLFLVFLAWLLRKSPRRKEW